MTVFEIKNSVCWVCGKEKANSSHHAIPKHLKPANNVLVNVCSKCHLKINKVDHGALASYTYKILKVLEEKKNAVMGIRKMLNQMKEEKKKDAPMSKVSSP